MFTIDDQRTRDMDDAVDVEASDTGWTVRVSIADAAKYVTPGSDLDVTARQRGATQYFATGNSPMLPRDLAEWKLSIFPDRTRSSMNIEILLDREANVTAVRVLRGEVVSQAKLTYVEVPSILDGEDHPLHANLRAAKNLALGLLTKRRNAGALIFYDLNKGWVTTEDGTLKKMKKREDTIGYIIIQELMVLTNVVMAQYMIEKGIPTLFRNHEAKSAAPGREALMQEIVALLDSPVVDLESLQKRNHLMFNRAEYGATCAGHYGLNEKAYLHFTSPIRRYADLVTHQQLRAHLSGKELPYTLEEVGVIATHLNTLNQDLRDKTRQSYTNKAESRAWHNIEARKLDGLSAKDFERAVKVELRGGESPSDALVEAWTRRLDQNNIPNLCATEVLMLLDGADGWDMLREATVEALEERPADAMAILNQAQSLGWRVANFDVQKTGPAHMPSFTAKAQLSMDALRKVFEVTVTYGVGGSAKAAKQRAAVELLRSIVLRRDDVSVTVQGAAAAPTPVKPDVQIDPNKNPVSVLMEMSQVKRTDPPTFTFDMAGPAHAPIMTCAAKFHGLEVQAVAANKQDAKTAAARALLTAYRRRG